QRHSPLFPYTTLFRSYGGDGQSTFALPDLRGRLPLHWGDGFILAETGGVEEVTLTVQQTPIHTHAFLASTNNALDTSPTNNVLRSEEHTSELQSRSDL